MIGNAKKLIGYESNLFTGSSVAAYVPATIVAAFKARVIAAGGSITATQESACLTLVTNLVNNNLWSKMKIIYPMVGGTSNSCKINLVDANYTATFSSGFTFTALGVTGSGVNSYMKANGFNPSVQLTSFNTCFSFYSRTNNTNTGSDLGCQLNPSTDRVALGIYYAATTYADLNNFTTGRIGQASTNTTGLYIINRESNVLMKMYRNAVQFGSTNTTTMNTALPNAIYAVCALDFNDGINWSSTTRQCAFAHVSTSLTSAEALTFYNNVQTFQTTLSRNV